jgi:hypothetical protein
MEKNVIKNIKALGISKFLLTLLISGILSTSVESNSMATSQHQWAAAYLSWSEPANSLSFVNTREFSQKITVHEISDNIFWAAQWNSPAVVAYGGIQSSGHLNFDGVGQKIAIFSVWDARLATAPTGSVCKAFGGEGVGYSCRRQLEFSQGSTLTIRFKLVAEESGTWLVMEVNLEPGGEVVVVGQILYPHSLPKFHNVGNFIEYYGNARSCNDVPLGSASFGPPISPSAGTLRFKAFSLPKEACVSAAADSPPIGQTGDVTLRFGGKDRPPSITTTTTTTTSTSIPAIGASPNTVSGKKCARVGTTRRVVSTFFVCKKTPRGLVWRPKT